MAHTLPMWTSLLEAMTRGENQGSANQHALGSTYCSLKPQDAQQIRPLIWLSAGVSTSPWLNSPMDPSLVPGSELCYSLLTGKQSTE